MTPPLASSDPERFWAELLSADPGRIREALRDLATEGRTRGHEHLRQMATGEGWQRVQQDRVLAALTAIEESGGETP